MQIDSQALHWEYIGLATCLAFSAFFSGSESALTALSDKKAHQLLDEGGRRTRILRLWVNHPARVLATLLIGNNLVNVAASVLAYRIASYYFGETAEAVAVGGMTLLVLIFGEVGPKTFAVAHAETLCIPLLRLVWIFDRIFFPLAWLLSRFGKRIVKLSTYSEMFNEKPLVTEDEIEYMIELGEREGVLEADRSEMLQSVMEFKETMVKEVMIPRTDMFALEDNLTVGEAMPSIIEKGHSRVPVYHERFDKIVGILYAKDILKAVQEEKAASTTPLSRIAKKELFFAVETQKIGMLLKEMRARRMHMAIVVDEFGGTAGIITMEDIIEEIVGEIHDEFDTEEPVIDRLDAHTFIVDAKISLRDLESVLNIELPDEGDFESLGGFLSLSAGRIPEIGQVIFWKDIRFTVTGADRKKIHTVEIRLPAEKPEDAET